MSHLLVITADGYGKLVPVDAIPLVNRTVKGVRFSREQAPEDLLQRTELIEEARCGVGAVSLRSSARLAPGVG